MPQRGIRRARRAGAHEPRFHQSAAAAWGTRCLAGSRICCRRAYRAIAAGEWFMKKMRLSSFLCWPAAMFAVFTTTVRADVSVQQKTSLEVASMIRMHGASTTNLTADKKREDTES